MNRLERRYRWLLSWYPPEYRLVYEEEMVGVLMAGAQPQQQRPGWRESVNLAWNASLARLGNRRRAVHDGRWYTASAVFGLLGALVLLTDQLRQAIGSHGRSDKFMNLYYYGPAVQRWVIVAGWAVTVLLLLLGWRHTAALAAWFTALFQLGWWWGIGYFPSLHMHNEVWWQIGLTISVAVALSVATRAGKPASLIGGRRIAALGVVAVLGAGLQLADTLLTKVTVYDDYSMGITPGLPLEWRAGVGLDLLYLLLSLVVFAAVARLSAPLRRRVVALFLPTVLLMVLGWMIWGTFGVLNQGPGPHPVILLLAAVVTFLTGVLVVRLLDRREQRVLPDPVSPS